MHIIWEFHHNHFVWLEWRESGQTKTTMKRFTEEAFEAFIRTNTPVIDDDLDFLN
jgi:hypothetical protein